ncbi:MAG TPA: NAD(P)-binding domain-containing protein, partial [Acidimicrobiales bacterium]|nr:NAD(P)-binding domain-containing protein [Acidimicrobiales bacterium]
RAALEHAEIPALLPALAAALDDVSLVPAHLRPDLSILMDPTAGLSPGQQAEARELALVALHRLRDAGGEVAAHPGPERLQQLLEFTTGGQPVDDYVELLREELALGEDLRAPTWCADEIAPDRPYRVAIIGAGMSGIVAAHRLHQAGVDVVVLEKNADVGGTWLENSYPGCRVDVSNHFYSYSFAQRRDWPEHFSSRDVLLDYFRGVADEVGVRPLIRFDTEVTAVELDESTMTWHLQLVGPDGESTLDADAVVSAVGQLNRPNLPDIPGVERFEGPAFHSARWDHSVDLTGKKVVVIGTGASAAQLIPVVADQAADLTIFQRTPAWFIPTPDYHEPVSPEVQWLFDNVPGYAHWYRYWIFWRNVEGLMPAATVDPDWDGGERSVSEINDLVRQVFADYLQNEFADAPELLAHAIPDYPPFAKRFIRDNGIWARTLKRDDVHLVTERIAEITPTGVRTADGALHEADVIIYGTGFQASDFLTPMKVVGRGGVDLHERWGGDARAYLGITLPGFPSLFLMYGPNTNIVVNGSIIYFSECEAHYITEAVRLLLESGHRALDPRPEVHDAFNAEVDAENLRMAWGVSSVSTWYTNATGRTAQNWPFSLLEYWRRTRAVDPADYELL